MRTVAQEREQGRRSWRVRNKLRDEFGKQASCGGRNWNVAMLEALLLAKVAEGSSAQRMSGGDAREMRQSGAACQQCQGEHTTQRNPPGEVLTTAEMGTSKHAVLLRWMIRT